ncbi:MAG: hypothetical protein HY329_15255 [Chloroflexi bacterium]|nr:hypothetical protein [Chloroflexota bacterium]
MTKKAIEPAHFPFYNYRDYSFALGLDTPHGVWLSGHTASVHSPEKKGMIVAGEGDIVAQSRVAYDKIRTILEATGLGLMDVVRTVDYVTANGIDDYHRTLELRREVFGDNPPVTNTVVVNRLLRPTAFIEIEAFASRAGNQLVGLSEPVDRMHRARARRVGDLVYLGAQLPVRPGTDEVVAPGDIVAQAQQIYENTSEILKAAGIGWEHIVKTVEFLAPDGLADYWKTGQVRRNFLAPHYPAATGILMPRLPLSGAMLQVDFVASLQPKSIVNPGWDRYAKLTYSPAVKAGNMLFLAGQGAMNPETNQVEFDGDIVGQTRYVYSNIMKVMKAAGVPPNAMVKTIEFVTPAALPRYRETANVRREFFDPPLPTATGIVCEKLLRPEMLIEVDAWAIVE